MPGPLINFDIVGGFADTQGSVPVLKANAGGGNFAAFVYQCHLNLDMDGAPTTYGWNNPAEKNSLGGINQQKNLSPLESWRKGWPGVTDSYSQLVGLGNACGDPGDGSKGGQNMINGNHNFYWSSVIALTRAEAGRTHVIDDREILEAFRKELNGPMVGKGDGWFPMVQPETSPYKGYYISTTSIYTDASLSDQDPAKYVNAADVPYAVKANLWDAVAINGRKVALGDYGLAIRNDTGSFSGFLFGDSGTPNRVGECSLNLYNSLTSAGNPLCTFIVFPGSGAGGVVGYTPEARLATVLMAELWKIQLTGNPYQLIERIYMGPSMQPAPQRSYQLNDEQNRTYLNIARALNAWGNDFVTEAGKPTMMYGTRP